jgi:hypothetical protein
MRCNPVVVGINRHESRRKARDAAALPCGGWAAGSTHRRTCRHHEPPALSIPKLTEASGVTAFGGARRAALRNQLEQLAGPRDRGEADPSDGASDDVKRRVVADWRDADADIGVAERPLAWIVWLVAPLGYLTGFENRMLVMTQWGFSFITRGRGAHLITDAAT